MISQLQSYDKFLNVVSVGYGKYLNRIEMEIVTNQLVTK